jgi:hypothetical protein
MPSALCALVMASLPLNAGYSDILEHNLHLISADKQCCPLKGWWVFFVRI